jgi:peptidoglycan hydrolase CwlO-like protein
MMSNAQIASTILISLITAVTGFLAARASSKASQTNVATSSRVEMEKEAYERARKMDTETIKRQDEELDQLFEKQKRFEEKLELLTSENERLHGENRIVLEDNTRLRNDITKLRQRIVRMERGLHPDDTGRIRERESDTNPLLPGRGMGVATDPMMREILDGRE